MIVVFLVRCCASCRLHEVNAVAMVPIVVCVFNEQAAEHVIIENKRAEASIFLLKK